MHCKTGFVSLLFHKQQIKFFEFSRGAFVRSFAGPVCPRFYLVVTLTKVRAEVRRLLRGEGRKRREGEKERERRSSFIL